MKGNAVVYQVEEAEDITMKLSSTLKTLIGEQGITIAKLSKRTGVPLQTIHNWLAGAEPRSLKQVKKVADYFGTSLDYLCFGIIAKGKNSIETYNDEINAGVFEVVLRRVKK